MSIDHRHKRFNLVQKIIFAIVVGLGLYALYQAVQPANGWEGTRQLDNFLTIVACRAQVRTEWEEHQRPIPGVEYLELKPNKDGEYECQRDVIDIFPRHPNQKPGGLSNQVACVGAGMMHGPVWQEQNPGWVVVAVGCPKPKYNNFGELLGYDAVPCPSNIECRFDKYGI